ncbi:MAG: YggS family pyridoxal phosphate-dependent enzyme [Clostridia bacterium]|nr:YggS family pyridoxal phosphate-dependent enzyme [Clostridia bacterium]
MSMTYIEKNLAAVRAELAEAEVAAGREGQTRLIAAVKYATDEELEALLSLGVAEVGENRVQQLLAHWDIIRAHGAQVHFIGTLQRNKVKYIVDKVAAIHSVDSSALAAEISRRAVAAGRTIDVYVEVNSGREEAKSGLLPEDAAALCREIVDLPGISLVGLMTMAPHCENPDDYHKYFAETRRLADEIWQALGLSGKPQLSMGMSESFMAAIAEGAHAVRVGRRLFLK